MKNRPDTLTASRMAALLACPRKHYWRYEVCLQTTEQAHALRFGSAWHNAMECRWKGMDYEAALSAVIEAADSLHGFDELDCATLAGMLAGYYAHYTGDAECVQSLQPEIEFRNPIAGSRTFDACGKLDGLGTHKDGRLILLEHKTAGEDIAPDSEYWLRLRFNQQISQYVLAAREAGWGISTVLFDVVRKPTIRQRQNESPEEYGNRLVADIRVRPEYYFARREVPVLDTDLAEFAVQRLELSRLILNLRAASRKLTRENNSARPCQAWPRNCGAFTCQGCEFKPFCLQNLTPDPANPPAGFKVGVANPELNVQCPTGNIQCSSEVKSEN